MAGWIYFIRSENDLIKIGFTFGKPEDRLSRLRTMSPVELSPLALIEGSKAREREFHERFYAHWSHGEWFFAVPELIDFIAAEAEPWNPSPRAFRRELVTLNPPRRVSVKDWALATMLTCDGRTLTVAQWAKRQKMTIWQIKCRLEMGAEIHWVLGMVNYPRKDGNYRPYEFITPEER